MASQGNSQLPATILEYLPNASQWLQHTPEFVLKYHPGPLQGDALAHAAVVFSNGEIKEHTGVFLVTGIKDNTQRKSISRALDAACVSNKCNPIQSPIAYDRIRVANIKKRYPRDSIAPRTINGKSLPTNPTLADLKNYGQQNAPGEWYLKADELFATSDIQQIGTAFGHSNKNATGNLKREVKRMAKAISEATSLDSPAVKLEVTDQDINRLNTTVEDMRTTYPKAAAMPVTGNGAVQTPTDDYLSENEYDLFVKQVESLDNRVRQLRANTAATPVFRTGYHIYDFLAVQLGGIQGGESASSIAEFKQTCTTTTLFSHAYSRQGTMDEYILAMLQLFKKQGQQGRVLKGVLTYVTRSMQLLQALLALSPLELDAGLLPGDGRISKTTPAAVLPLRLIEEGGAGSVTLNPTASSTLSTALGSSSAGIKHSKLPRDNSISNTLSGKSTQTWLNAVRTENGLRQLGDVQGVSASSQAGQGYGGYARRLGRIVQYPYAASGAVSELSGRSWPVALAPSLPSAATSSQEYPSSQARASTPLRDAETESVESSELSSMDSDATSSDSEDDGEYRPAPTEYIPLGAVQELRSIMTRLFADAPAILTTPQAMLNTFDTTRGIITGLDEARSAKRDFRVFCDQTTIFEHNAGSPKFVDRHAGLAIQAFIHGPKESGTFLDHLMDYLSDVVFDVDWDARLDAEDAAK